MHATPSASPLDKPLGEHQIGRCIYVFEHVVVVVLLKLDLLKQRFRAQIRDFWRADSDMRFVPPPPTPSPHRPFDAPHIQRTCFTMLHQAPCIKGHHHASSICKLIARAQHNYINTSTCNMRLVETYLYTLCRISVLRFTIHYN